MPPSLALLLSLVFMVSLIWRDSRQQPKPSAAVWIPCIWLAILGSRAVSQWLDPATSQSGDDLLEGSPLDAIVYLALIAGGCLVLWRRRLALSDLFRSNVWLTVFFVYCAISVLWSDLPVVAFKRWFKGLGDPVMVLVLLTDVAPAKAFETVIRRCAYFHVPLSIVLIKYYPHLGRSYSEWTGAAYYRGVALNRNMLGYFLLVYGLFFLCALLGKGAMKRRPARWLDFVVALIFLSMIAWLFQVSDSKTPLMALLVGGVVILGLRFSVVRRRFGTYMVLALLIFGVLQLSFNLTESVVVGAGRDTSLTGRTDLWRSVLRMAVDPLIGAGFESFWLGDRLKKLWAEYYFKPTQAHNGYIEVYLNLGWIGLILVGGVLCAAYRTVLQRLVRSSDPRSGHVSAVVFATFGIAYLSAYVLYNITEGTLRGLNFLFVIFLVIAIDCVRVRGRNRRWRAHSLPHADGVTPRPLSACHAMSSR